MYLNPKNMMKPIQVRPSNKEKYLACGFAIFFGGLVFGGITGNGIIGLLETSSIENIHQELKMQIFFGCFIVTAILMVALCFHVYNKYYWYLNDDKLLGGEKRNIQVPFNSIQKIVIGLPTSYKSKKLFNIFNIHGLGKLNLIARQNAIVLFLDEGRLLILCLLFQPSGVELMNSLCGKLEKKIQKYDNEKLPYRFLVPWNKIVIKINRTIDITYRLRTRRAKTTRVSAKKLRSTNRLRR